jgi:hypothetical protein
MHGRPLTYSSIPLLLDSLSFTQLLLDVGLSATTMWLLRAAS